MGKNGFSLIELLTVVAIIAILSAIAIPGYIGQQKRAARSEAFNNLTNLRMLEEQLFADRGNYTISLGTAGKDHPLNSYDDADSNKGGLIQRGNAAANAIDSNNALVGFKPGKDTAFSYWILSGQRITNTATKPPTTAAIAAGDPPCFVALAQGNTNGKVLNETYAIDCNNTKNY